VIDHNWEFSKRWLHRDDLTFHSHYPQTPPAGYIRLGYRNQVGPDAQGPNYVYIKPGWLLWVRGDSVAWVEPRRQGVSGATVDEETFRLLQPHRKPEQLSLF